MANKSSQIVEYLDDRIEAFREYLDDSEKRRISLQNQLDQVDSDHEKAKNILAVLEDIRRGGDAGEADQMGDLPIPNRRGSDSSDDDGEEEEGLEEEEEEEPEEEDASGTPAEWDEGVEEDDPNGEEAPVDPVPPKPAKVKKAKIVKKNTPEVGSKTGGSPTLLDYAVELMRENLGHWYTLAGIGSELAGGTPSKGLRDHLSGVLKTAYEQDKVVGLDRKVEERRIFYRINL